jgi:hypothetical protein
MDLDQLFLAARAHNDWLDKEISNEQIQQIYDVVKWGLLLPIATDQKIL